MNRLDQARHQLALRKYRIRQAIRGTTDRPRLSVFISHKHISAQITDDSKHSTLVAATSIGQKNMNKPMIDKAAWVGAEIGKKARAAKIKRVVLDRNGRLYHGRVKSLADAAREQGLEF